jgi:hypothetical protein
MVRLGPAEHEGGGSARNERATPGQATWPLEEWQPIWRLRHGNEMRRQDASGRILPTACNAEWPMSDAWRDVHRAANSGRKGALQASELEARPTVRRGNERAGQ